MQKELGHENYDRRLRFLSIRREPVRWRKQSGSGVIASGDNYVAYPAHWKINGVHTEFGLAIKRADEPGKVWKCTFCSPLRSHGKR